MKHKYGKFYADWRDEHGVRHAKAFKLKKHAERFAKKMQAAAAEKKPEARPHRANRESVGRGVSVRKAIRHRSEGPHQPLRAPDGAPARTAAHREHSHIVARPLRQAHGLHTLRSPEKLPPLPTPARRTGPHQARATDTHAPIAHRNRHARRATQTARISGTVAAP